MGQYERFEMDKHPTLHDVYRAQLRIKPVIWKTPIISATALAEKSGAASMHLKLESLQHTGAFKVRGAANKILRLDAAEKQRGVITFSTGNHGKAVAYVAGQLGIRAVVCLSEHVAHYRVKMIESLGAQVVQKGRSQDEAERHYLALAAEKGYTPVVPFDDPMIIAGQGTIALEILAELPDTDILLIQVSGGGLMAGIAMAAKSINPGIHIIGLSIERSPAMLKSVETGSPVQVAEKNSIADSLLGGIGFDNRHTLHMVKRHVDEHHLLTEQEIEDGMFYIFETHRLVVEGAAALGVAALLHKKINVSGKKVVGVLSGSSIDSVSWTKIIQSRLC